MNGAIPRWLVVGVLCLCTHAVRAQHQYDVWQFGYFAGLDFRGGSVAASTAPFYTDEGSSMWCDPVSGALKFSTDGRVVYRADGSVMPDGTGLRGGPSSSSSALIVPFPSSNMDTPTSFYVFCIGDQSWLDSTADDSALTVSVVDFASDVNGTVLQKNTVIADGLAEKLVATHHCDGQSFWVIVHARSEPVFYAYRVSAQGIGQPVVSRVGRQLTPTATQVRGGPYGQGLMAVSQSGSKIAMAVPFSYSAEVFDFNTATGEVSNPVVLDSSSRTYGICFSPSAQLVYTVEWTSRFAEGPAVRQFDLQNLGSDLELGRLIDDDVDFHLGGIQLGPDGTLWLAESAGLAQIQFPDVVGTGCRLVHGRVSLQSPARIVIGLPNLITSYYDNSRLACAPPLSAIQADTVICVGSCVDVADASRNSPTSWQWEFDGGIPPSYTGVKPPPICYSVPGVFKQTLIATNQYGSDTTERYVRVVPLPDVSAGADVILCDSAAGKLNASGADRYEWEYNPGLGNKHVADPVVRVFAPTQFVVRGWNADGCSATDTVMVYTYTNGRPPVVLHTPSISGVAGGLGTVVVLNNGSKPVGTVTLELHLPAAAFADPVVERGTLLSSSRPSLEEIVLQIQPHNATSDTLCLVKGTFLLTSQTHRMWAVGVSQNSCDSFISEPGQISTNTCGGNVRMVVLTGEEPKLTIGQSDHTVNVHAPRNMDLTLECWDSGGARLMRHVFRQHDETVSFSLPNIHGVLLLLLRFDYGAVTKVVLLP